MQGDVLIVTEHHHHCVPCTPKRLLLKQKCYTIQEALLVKDTVFLLQYYFPHDIKENKKRIKQIVEYGIFNYLYCRLAESKCLGPLSFTVKEEEWVMYYAARFNHLTFLQDLLAFDAEHFNIQLFLPCIDITGNVRVFNNLRILEMIQKQHPVVSFQGVLVEALKHAHFALVHAILKSEKNMEPKMSNRLLCHCMEAKSTRGIEYLLRLGADNAAAVWKKITDMEQEESQSKYRGSSKRYTLVKDYLISRLKNN
jgi:hypothetical protein